MRPPHLTLNRIQTPCRYGVAQAFLLGATITGVALLVFKAYFGGKLGVSSQAMHWTGLGITAGFGTASVLTHLFWKRVPEPASPFPSKAASPEPTPVSPHCSVTTPKLLPAPLKVDEELLQQLGEIHLIRKDLLTDNPESDLPYNFTPMEEYWGVEKSKIPLFRYPTSVPASFGLKYEPWKQRALAKQMGHLDQRYVYQYVKGDGDCFYTAQVSGYLHATLALLIEDPDAGLAKINDLKAQIPLIDFEVIDRNTKKKITFFTQTIHEMLDALATNPVPNTLRDIMVNYTNMKAFTSYLRYISAMNEDPTKPNEVVIFEDKDAAMLLFTGAQNELLEFDLILSSLFLQGVSIADNELGNLKEQVYPSEGKKPGVFYNGEHFDVLIPRHVMETIVRKQVELQST
jgi:hypothetical protein